MRPPFEITWEQNQALRALECFLRVPNGDKELTCAEMVPGLTVAAVEARVLAIEMLRSFADALETYEPEAEA